MSDNKLLVILKNKVNNLNKFNPNLRYDKLQKKTIVKNYSQKYKN